MLDPVVKTSNAPTAMNFTDSLLGTTSIHIIHHVFNSLVDNSSHKQSSMLLVSPSLICSIQILQSIPKNVIQSDCYATLCVQPTHVQTMFRQELLTSVTIQVEDSSINIVFQVPNIP